MSSVFLYNDKVKLKNFARFNMILAAWLYFHIMYHIGFFALDANEVKKWSLWTTIIVTFELKVFLQFGNCEQSNNGGYGIIND